MPSPDTRHQLNPQEIRQTEDGSGLAMGVRMYSIGLYIGDVLKQGIKNVSRLVSATGAYFSPSWTAFQAERGRDFSVIVDGISN